MNNSIIVVINPMGNKCNLSCSYCYKKEHSCQIEKGLSLNKLYKLVDTLATKKELKNIKFNFHGGEPLLYSLENYQKFIEYQNKILKEKDVSISIQTNGTLLNDKIITFCKENNIFIGLSLDGASFKENQERFSNEKTYIDVIENIKKLKKINNRFAIHSVAHQNNFLERSSLYKLIENIQPEAFTIIPVDSTDKSIILNDEQWLMILKEAFIFSKKTGIVNQYIESLEKGLIEKIPSMCMLNGKCHSFISIDEFGNAYSSCNTELNLKFKTYDEALNYVVNGFKLSDESIFSKSGYNDKLIYFQGSGCQKKETNQFFIKGVLDFLNWRLNA